MLQIRAQKFPVERRRAQTTPRFPSVFSRLVEKGFFKFGVKSLFILIF